jgi:drug/metabolite transporter (DMT)-like permease
VNAGAIGALAAFLSSVTWAIGSSFYSRLSREHSVFSVNIARALFALPLFVLTACVLAGGVEPALRQYALLGGRQLGWFAVSMVASYGLGDALFLLATHRLGVTSALSIASCYPLWSALAGWLFQGQRLGLSQAGGLLLVVSGVVLVILSAPREPSPGRAPSESAGRLPLVGLALAFGTSLLWSLNGLAIVRAGEGIPMAVGNTVRMSFAIVLSALFARLLGNRAPLLLPRGVFARSSWIFLLEAYGGSGFFLYGLSHTPLAIGATLSSLAPVLSVPVALFLGLERFSVLRTSGILGAVLGLRLLLGP